MDRRQILTGLGTIAAAAPALNFFSSEAFAAGAATPSDQLIATAGDCIETGMKCEKLCIETLSKGDKGMAECLVTVQAMMTMVQAAAELAAQKSPMLGKVAALCATACEDCKKECDKHAKHHEICGACAKACDECIKACKKIAA